MFSNPRPGCNSWQGKKKMFSILGLGVYVLCCLWVSHDFVLTER